jgi:diamine N-acetyltransferase
MSLGPADVSLREITSQSVIAVVQLAVADDQKQFVARNSVSLAQALFEPRAWYRAIYCGAVLVGFVMLKDESLAAPTPANPKIDIWRFMIDERYQRRGLGKAAMLKVIDHARAKGLFDTLDAWYIPGPGSAERFYLGLGFGKTGAIDRNEIQLSLPLISRVPRREACET